MDLNYLYKEFTTPDLNSAIAGIRGLAIRGCAISMPYKEEMMQYLDHIDPPLGEWLVKPALFSHRQYSRLLEPELE